MIRLRSLYGVRIFSLKFILIVILCIVIFFSIGFASFSSNLMIGDMKALVRVQKDIRITSFSVSGSFHDAISNYEEYDVHSIFSYVYLPYQDSSISYDVVITNIGNIEMGLLNIIGLPDNLDYQITNYELESSLCDDNDSLKCKLGSITTLHVNIFYRDDGYDSDATDFNIKLDFNFFSSLAAARIGNRYYDTLQDAILDVPFDGSEVNIVLLRNISEVLTVSVNQNIYFDLQNFTISNVSNNVVLTNYGKVSISSGTITSSAGQGAINNESGAELFVNGGSIIATGIRQAIYNNGGSVTISGDAYLSSTSNQRATVQNLVNGTLVVTGGTITSSRFRGIDNVSDLVIGVNDGSVYRNSPLIIGEVYGINSSVPFSFYDGIVKGKNASFSGDSSFSNIENGYDVISVVNASYHVSYLGIASDVTFDFNDGMTDNLVYRVETGTSIGDLPVPTRDDYVFDGWFTERDGGVEVDSNTVVLASSIYYAHWVHSSLYVVAYIGDVSYSSIQDAIDAVSSNNSEVVIRIVRNASEALTVSRNKNILFELNGYRISNKGSGAVLSNYGRVTMLGGMIMTNSSNTAAVNNYSSGTFTFSSGSIIATGARQAIYNNGGTVYINNDAYLSSTALERATIHNLENSTLVITGGTIVSKNQEAVINYGIFTMGVKDGDIHIDTPILVGATYGVTNYSIFNFYDGIIRGVNGSVDGNIDDIENNNIVVYSNEVIDNITYISGYLGN